MSREKLEQEGMYTAMTVSAFAKTVGMTEGSVRAAIRTKKIIRGAFKQGNTMKINAFVAAAEWGKEFVEEWAHLNEEIPAIEGDASEDQERMAKARLDEQIYKAELMRIKIEEAERRLVDKAQVSMTLANWGTELREALLRIPDRITDEVILAARTKARRDVHNIIHAALEVTLLQMTEIVERDISPR